ncbi:TraR/DksA family transcriptional regulator [Rarobacter faecitabidus]|nr:TraR/DksA family transcriptional regulator [Rarobacter faecitabidus]
MTTSESQIGSTAAERFPHLRTDAAEFVVREGEKPWTPEELEKIADDLLTANARVSGELNDADRFLGELLRNSGDGAGDDQADSGSSALEREHELSMINNLRDLLAQNNRALERIDNKTYGQCEQCGQAIGKARLQAFPRATLCVTCKQREERR